MRGITESGIVVALAGCALAKEVTVDLGELTGTDWLAHSQYAIVFPLIKISEPEAIRELCATPVHGEPRSGDLVDSQGLFHIAESPKGFYLNDKEVVVDLARLDEFTTPYVRPRASRGVRTVQSIRNSQDK